MRLSRRVSRRIRALVITRWIYRATVCANREKVEAPIVQEIGAIGGGGQEGIRANSTLIRSGLIAVPGCRDIGDDDDRVVLFREA